MKVILIHGEDNLKSFERFSKLVEEARKRDWEIVKLDESAFSFSENISSGSLFGNSRFFIHRNFSKMGKKDLDWLQKNISKYEGNLILYSDTTVPKLLIAKLPKDTRMEEYKLPVLIWKFLEAVFPGNSKQAIRLLHEVTESEPVEFLFGLLIRHMKELYRYQIDPESFNLPSWRMLKIKTQSYKFDENALTGFIDDMAKLDIKSKTTDSDLISLLDFAIISKLE